MLNLANRKSLSNPAMGRKKSHATLRRVVNFVRYIHSDSSITTTPTSNRSAQWETNTKYDICNLQVSSRPVPGTNMSYQIWVERAHRPAPRMITWSYYGHHYRSIIHISFQSNRSTVESCVDAAEIRVNDLCDPGLQEPWERLNLAVWNIQRADGWYAAYIIWLLPRLIIARRRSVPVLPSDFCRKYVGHRNHGTGIVQEDAVSFGWLNEFVNDGAWRVLHDRR